MRRSVLLPLIGFGWLIASLTQQAGAWQPGSGFPNAASGFTVDVSNRRDVLAFHQHVYPASENYASNLGWTGNVATGNAGTTGAAFKEDVRRRVNYYRALSGLPGDIIFNAVKSAKCQQAALMMSANNALSHTPPPSWLYYTADGSQAALASSLAYGYYGPGAVDTYMLDFTAGNEDVGHRRWLLFSRAQEMATGDIPQNGSVSPINSLWVIGDFKPTPTPTFVAWPNEGYVPHPVLPVRWSLSYPDADFGTASVSMSLNGGNVPLTIISRTANYGDKTIVWEPTGLPTSVTSDVPYVVTVSGIQGAGVPTSKTYTVRIFNPDLLGETISITGNSNPPPYGGIYSFNSIEQADAYELELANFISSSWTEGAEISPIPRVISTVSSGYSLIQSSLWRTGSKAFQLAFPAASTTDQSFVIDRQIVPSATSRLRYHDLARFSLPQNTLETQVSTNGGATWTTLFSRAGVTPLGSSSFTWDAAWQSRDLSLATYAGQIIQIRFIYKRNQSQAYQGADANYGFFIDDISVTNAAEAVSSKTPIVKTANSFTLTSGIGGAPLVAGNSFQMRMRARIGQRWFESGPAKSVTIAAQPTPSFASWAAFLEFTHALPAGSLSVAAGDFDQDGRSNLIEYAFGGTPVVANDINPRLPQSRIEAGRFVLRYQADSSIANVALKAEASHSLGNWQAVGGSGAPMGFTEQIISTVGTLQTRDASVPLSSAAACFLRVQAATQ